MFERSFPHFDDLELVYGKDKATEIDAKDYGDTSEALHKEMQEDVLVMDDDVNIDEV